MATKKQKQELIDILKFTPITVTLSIQGYGGESYAGVVDRKIYDYFKERKLDLEHYATDWDNEMNIPDELQPFPAGSAYECDNLWHASGAELSSLNTIRISDENNNDVWEHSADYSELEELGVTVNETGGSEISDLDEGTVVFWGGQGEKGCFFDAEFVLRAPFDPKKLTINYENCDDWYLITGVEYDGEELEGSGGYSTTGKWAENKWIIVGDEEVYEAEEFDPEDSNKEEEDVVADYECVQCDWKGSVDEVGYDDNDKMVCPECGEPIEAKDSGFDWSPLPEEPAVTDWFDKDVKPTIKGTYEAAIDAAWPLSGIRMVEWTGRSWKEDGKKIAITKWRGLSEDPNKE